jgi:RNA polymerase sigma-70 factor (ECF subfamily)
LLSRYLQHGDAAAFDQLYERMAPRLGHLARRMGVPEDQLEDVVQDVFLDVLSAPGRFDATRSFRAWAGGITWRRIAAARRRHVQRVLPAGTLDRPRPPQPPEQMAAEELRGAVTSALERLAPGDREVLQLHFVERLRATEIARRQSLKSSTVRSRIARALARLRDELPVELAPAVLLLLRPGRLAVGSASTPSLVLRATLGGAALILAAAAVSPAIEWPAASAEPAFAAAEDLDRRPAPLDPGHRASSFAPRRFAPTSDSVPGAAPEGADGATVRVRFVDRRTGAPIPSFTFAQQLWDSRGPPSTVELARSFRGLTADERGVAVLQDVREGTLRLRYNAGTGSPLLVVDGDGELEAVVDAAAVVEGQVRDAQGRPVAGAEVWVDEITSASFSCPYVADRTDSRGRYRVAFAFGMPRKVWARQPGRTSSEARVVGLNVSTPSVIDLALEPATAELVGFVTDSTGAPSADVHVTLCVRGETPTRSLVYRTTTEEDGRFRFGTLPAGAGTVIAVGRGGSTAVCCATLAEGERTTRELELESGGVVAGSATPGMVVGTLPTDAAWSRWELARIGVTGPDGRFTLTSVPPGEVDLLMIDPADGTVLAREVAAVSRGARFEWNPVLDPRGVPDQKHRLRRYVRWLVDPSSSRPPRHYAREHD